MAGGRRARASRVEQRGRCAIATNSGAIRGTIQAKGGSYSGTLDTFKATAYPKQAAAAQLTAETTIDGLPAVTYCITSGARTIPFSVVTAIIRPDFTVELRVQPIAKD